MRCGSLLRPPPREAKAEGLVTVRLRFSNLHERSFPSYCSSLQRCGFKNVACNCSLLIIADKTLLVNPSKQREAGFEPLTRQGMKNAPGPGHKKCCKWCAVRDVRAFALRSRTACARLRRAPAGNMPKGMLPPLGFESLTAFPKKKKRVKFQKVCPLPPRNPR